MRVAEGRNDHYTGRSPRASRVKWNIAWLMALLVAWVAPAITAAEEDEAQKASPRIGDYRVTFTERSPKSPLAEQLRHMRFRLTKQAPGYKLAKESFEVYVPKAYAADHQQNKPWGLFVWISSNASGSLPRMWREVLAKRKLIYIGANNAGNPRDLIARFGLQLDAVHNMKQRYRLDEDRIYVSGVSGGGRTASMLALLYPKLFCGCFPIVGVNYFRNLPITVKGQRRQIPPSIRPPVSRDLAYMKQHSRFALLTGSKDYNREPTLVTYRHGFLKDRFKHVTYLEVPEMGHALPNAEWFDKGLAFLDSTLKGGDDKRGKAKPQPKPDPKPTSDVKQRDKPAKPRASEAKRLLALARSYLAAGRADLATKHLNEIVEKHADSEHAAQAKTLLRSIEKD